MACLALSWVVVASGVTEAAQRAPARASEAIVASPQPLATLAGRSVLAAGGNVVDAAVAVSFAIAVTEPWGSGIGGGAFMVVHLDGVTRTFDMRERAPAAATRDMFVVDGEVEKGASIWSARAAGVPGLVKGLVEVHRSYGKLPLAVVMAPAISYARDGIPVTEKLRRTTEAVRERMNDAAKAIFLTPEGQAWPAGALLRQVDLARTLERVAATGGEDFYRGETARELVAAVRSEGGLWTLEDLAGYEVVERPPVTGSYRGFEVRSMGPPSSGGLLVVQMLAVLEAFDLKGAGWGGAEYCHLLAETMKRAFALRAEGLGDPDHAAVDWARFIGPEVVSRLRAEVKAAARATPAAAISSFRVKPGESTHTSHFGVLLAGGDAVAMTQTINLWFGNARVAGSTGVVLNNEMDDFSAMPGAPNAFGMVGAEANSIAPGKRPLSSMTPTLLLTPEGRAVGVFGSPGGSRIITTTLQAILNVVDHGMDAGEAVGAPRIHHQWYPDILYHEPFGLSPDTAEALRARGHEVGMRGPMGNASALWVGGDGALTGAADPRGDGTAGGL